MKRRGLSIGILLWVAWAGLPCAWADTIYFKDGTAIDCFVSEEKKKFT